MAVAFGLVLVHKPGRGAPVLCRAFDDEYGQLRPSSDQCGGKEKFFQLSSERPMNSALYFPRGLCVFPGALMLSAGARSVPKPQTLHLKPTTLTHAARILVPTSVALSHPATPKSVFAGEIGRFGPAVRGA